MTEPLATIGYERATLPQVIERLREASVEIVVDVRAVSSSRRPGFSKRALAASLDESGIRYIHLRPLGTPAAGRQAAREGRTEEMRAIFRTHMQEPDAQLALREAIDIARSSRACLLCFEEDAAHCHRRILADEIRGALGCAVRDL